MRVFVFANNLIGWRVIEEVAKTDEIVGVAVHPRARSKYRDEIVEASGVGADRVVDGSTLRTEATRDFVRELAPEVGVSALFGYVVPQEILDLLPAGCVNLHPAYLPYNRGAYPNVWGIVEGTGAGVTLHYMDATVDTGDIIARREVAIEPIDTGESLYARLERESVVLFRDEWPSIRTGRARRTRQEPGDGTAHRVRDVTTIDEIDLDKTYTARELIDVLRARTFGSFPGAYFVHDGRKVFMTLQLRYEDRPEGERTSAAGSDSK